MKKIEDSLRDIETTLKATFGLHWSQKKGEKGSEKIFKEIIVKKQNS